MDVSGGDLMQRVTREVKRVLRQNREILFKPDYLAALVVQQDPLIHREACLWGMSTIRHTADGRTIIEPDMDLVESWVEGVFRKFTEKANRFGKWIRRHYYVTKFSKEEGKYYLPYSPACGHGPAGQ